MSNTTFEIIVDYCKFVYLFSFGYGIMVLFWMLIVDKTVPSLKSAIRTVVPVLNTIRMFVHFCMFIAFIVMCIVMLFSNNNDNLNEHEY